MPADRRQQKTKDGASIFYPQEVFMSLHVRSLALGGAAVWLAFAASPAFSADATQVADALIAAMQASDKTKASYGGAAAAGDDVTITDFSATNANGGTVNIPTLTITGAQMRDKGGFTAAGMTFDNAKVVDNNSNITLQTASLTDAIVPSADEIKAKVHMRPFGGLNVGGITIEGGDLPAPLEIDSIAVAIDTDQAGNPRDFDMKVNAINIPPEVFAQDAQSKAVLDQLGYNGFVVNISVAGGYETEGDKVTLRTFTIDAADVGKLAISGKFNGVSLSKLFQDGNPGEASANGTLESLTIRFDNSGIVERVLDMQAKMMGVQRQDVVAQTAGALPFMLNFLGNPPFQEKVAQAGNTFLNDPKSLTISASPAQPVPFSQISGAAGKSPQSLPDLLAVDVTANN
jgi:hypothetical protein